MICEACGRTIPARVVADRTYVYSKHTGAHYCPATDRRCDELAAKRRRQAVTA